MFPEHGTLKSEPPSQHIADEKEASKDMTQWRGSFIRVFMTGLAGSLNDPKAFAVCRGVAVLFWGTFLGINKARPTSEPLLKVKP